MGVSPGDSAFSPTPSNPFAPGEWESLVAAAVAAVAQAEATEQAEPDDAHESSACDLDDAVSLLVDSQPVGARVYTLPVEPGASARILTWQSRTYWLTLCEWVVTSTERGRAALKRHRIAAGTFLRGCAAHAAFAESSTGRRVAACLSTLVDRSGLSVDQIKRCRRVLRTLELGVEQVRGKKLNSIERAAAARHYENLHGRAPVQFQSGAASVWCLSAPLWAVTSMPAPTKPPRRSTRRRPRRSSRPTTQRNHATSTPTRPDRSGPCAPQSPSGFVLSDLSVRKDHQARTRDGEEKLLATKQRPLNLQRAAAELVLRIPALHRIVGRSGCASSDTGHIGVVCDLLVEAGIDTDRWTGIDIANALTHDGSSRRWTWPATSAMRSPLRLVAYRLALLDWTSPSPTEAKVAARKFGAESDVSAAYRLIRGRRSKLAEVKAKDAPPASVQHRMRVRAELAAHLASTRHPATR